MAARMTGPQGGNGASDAARDAALPAQPTAPAKRARLARRRLVAGSAAILAGAMAAAAAAPTARAADKQPLVLGRVNAEATATELDRNNPGTVDDALRVHNDNGPGVAGQGTIGVRGVSSSENPGVPPFVSGVGVFGAGDVGVTGAGRNIGVSGDGDRIGVQGGGFTGVIGQGSGMGGIGVDGSGGFGVRGSGRIGVVAAGSTTGIEASAEFVGVQARGGQIGMDALGVQGVVGHSTNPDTGVGVRGTGPEPPPPPGVAPGPPIGVLGEGTAQGVRGESMVASATGVLGTTTDGNGVVGRATGNGRGVVGSSQNAAGVLALNASGTRARLATPALAGEFFGNVFIHGELTFVDVAAAAVGLPDGSHRRIYGVSGAEPWVEDVGAARLINGAARVELDPDFAAVVRADYHVFLTPRADSNGLYVSSQTPAEFTVREQRGGTGSFEFSFRILARRRDLGVRRLERVELSSQPPDVLLEAQPVPQLPARPAEVLPSPPDKQPPPQ
jgi:hypothetical protein